MKKIILLSLAAVFLSATVVLASTISLSSSAVKIEKGKIIKVAVQVDPSSQKIYTVKTQILYDSNKMDFISFSYAKDWVPVSIAGYDSVDEGKGVIVKTAGRPGGLLEKAVLGTASFLVKKEGRAVIKIGTESFVLDSKNSDILSNGSLSNSSIAINIVNPPQKTPEEIAEIFEESGPQKLFDIKMETYPNSLTHSKDLTSYVSFINFGSVPTPIDLTFKILSESGRVLMEESDSLTVETENIFVKKFSESNLGPGKYTVVLKTNYGDNVQDEFKNNFTIISPDRRWWTNPVVITTGVFALFFIFFLIGNAIGRRKRVSSRSVFKGKK